MILRIHNKLTGIQTLENKEQLELYVNQLRNTLQEFEKKMDHEFSVEEWGYLLEQWTN